MKFRNFEVNLTHGNMLNNGGQSEQPIFSQLSQGLAGLTIF